MFLNFRRSFVRYIFLWIFTLSFYHFLFRRAVIEDTKKILPDDEDIKTPDIKYYLLYLVTFGVYGVICDMKLAAKWCEYLNQKEVYYSYRPKKYFIMAVVPFVRVIALPMYFKLLNLACKTYSDAQFEEDEEDDYYVPLSKIRRKAEEKRKHDDEHEVAGVQIVAEYDFENDNRRVFRQNVEDAPVEEAVVEEEIIPEEPEEDPESFFRNKKWFKRVFAAMLAIFMLPLITVIASLFVLPPVYEDTFVGELGEKYKRLKSIDEPKIVVIGGSSVAFGLDSAMMEKHLDMPVVNFGLYANLGTKLMMDLSKANINEGDIIILAPEMNSQTLSLYFNSETTAQALDGNMSMLFRVDSDDYEALIGASWKFTSDKLSYLLTGERPANSGAYMKENFNEYGDNIYDRPYNEMTSIQNIIDLNFRTNYIDSIDSEYEQYIQYVNAYVNYARSKGAEVYFSFPPMNEAAMSPTNDSEYIATFYKNLLTSINCSVISNINDYIMDEGYFFDSEFHLNNAGVVVRTVRLIDDIKRELGITTVTMEPSDLPEPPGFKPSEVIVGDEENLYLNLELVENASGKHYVITGLNAKGMTQTEIKIPNTIDSIPIRVLEADALSGSALEKLYLGENITAINGRAFRGASKLTAVYVADGKTPDDISVPNNMSESLMTEGCNPALKIYVDAPYYTSYASDYFWGDYGTFLAEK